MKSILVTGGGGFVGQNLVPLLLKNGYKVTVAGREAKSPFGKNVRYLKADLTVSPPVGGSPALTKEVARVDAIVHLAGMIHINYSLSHPAEVIRNNVDSTLNLLEAARVSKRRPLVVFSSTDRVYGRTKKRKVDESEPPFPIEPYVASKIACETFIEAYHGLYGMPYVILRMDSIYGPHQTPMFISDVIKKMALQDEISTGKLDVRKNFVYVGDVADAFLRALRANKSAHSTIYNIGGAHVSLKDVLKEIQNAFERRGKKVRVQFDPSLVRKGGTEVASFTLSTKKAEKHLGWKARTALPEGVEKTVAWFLANDLYII